MLTYTCEPADQQLLEPQPFRSTGHTVLYDPPIEEFSVLLTHLQPNEEAEHGPIDGPSIFIVVQGAGARMESIGLAMGRHHFAKDGEVFFVGANTPVKFISGDVELVVYRAFVESPRS